MKKIAQYKKLMNILLAITIIFICILGTSAKHAHKVKMPKNGLIAKYLFKKMKPATDATLNGQIALSADRYGKMNNAYQFNGDDTFVELDTNPEYNLSPGGFTLSLWVKADKEQISADDHFTIIGNLHKSKSGWAIQGCTDHYELKFLVGNGEGFKAAEMDAKLILDDEWHHLMATYDGENLKFFLDCELMAVAEDIGTPVANDIKVSIGKFPNESKRYFKGLIDDVYIYNRALDIEEIEEHNQA